MKQALEDNLAATKQLPGASAQSTLTLASDQITPTGAFHLVDTQAAAATDNLAQILQTNLPDGSWLMLGIVNASRTVVFKHAAGGTGQLTMLAGADVTVDNITTFMSFQRKGTLWEERQRFYGTAQAAFRQFYAVAGLAQNTFTGRQEWKEGANLTAATTLTLGTDGNSFRVNGTASITGVSAAPAGTLITLIIVNGVTLVHDAATFTLNPPVTRFVPTGARVQLLSSGSGAWGEVGSGAGGGLPSFSGAGGSHNGSQGETAIYSGTIAANTLSGTRRLRLTGHCSMTWRNNPPDTLTLRFKYGFGTLTLPAVNDPGAGASTPLRFEAWMSSVAPPTNNWGFLVLEGTANPSMVAAQGQFGVDETAAQTMQITAQISAVGSPSTVSITLVHATLELV